MPAPTLRSLAQRSCIRHLSGLDDLGQDIPYELVAPILRKIDNPSQLRLIETNSPHIADFDAEIWKSFLRRDTSWQQNPMEPKNPRSWHKVYNKLVAAERRQLERQEKNLESRIKQMDKERQDRTVAFIPQLLATPDGKKDRSTVSKIRGPHASIKDGIRKMQRMSRGAGVVTPYSQDTRKLLHEQAISQITTAPASLMKRAPVPIHPYVLEQQKERQKASKYDPVFRILPPQAKKQAQGERFADALRLQQKSEQERRQRLLQIKNSSPVPATVGKASAPSPAVKPSKSTPISAAKSGPVVFAAPAPDDSLDFWTKQTFSAPTTKPTSSAGRNNVETTTDMTKVTTRSSATSTPAKSLPLTSDRAHPTTPSATTSALSPETSPTPPAITTPSSGLKRTKTSVFMPAKRRRVG